MKRHLLRHVVQFGAGIALCATVLTRMPSGELSMPNENNGSIATEAPVDNNVPPQSPEIEPQGDQGPDINIPELEKYF